MKRRSRRGRNRWAACASTGGAKAVWQADCAPAAATDWLAGGVAIATAGERLGGMDSVEVGKKEGRRRQGSRRSWGSEQPSSSREQPSVVDSRLIGRIVHGSKKQQAPGRPRTVPCTCSGRPTFGLDDRTRLAGARPAFPPPPGSCREHSPSL